MTDDLERRIAEALTPKAEASRCRWNGFHVDIHDIAADIAAALRATVKATELWSIDTAGAGPALQKAALRAGIAELKGRRPMSDYLERRVAEALWPYVRDDCMSQGTAERLAAKFAVALRAVEDAASEPGEDRDPLAAGLAALEGTDNV